MQIGCQVFGFDLTVCRLSSGGSSTYCDATALGHLCLLTSDVVVAATF